MADVSRDIVTIGASAGGVAMMSRLFALLPVDFPGIIAAVLHRSPSFTASRLPEVLGLRAALAISDATDGEPMRRGRIYVAPPDHHLRIQDDRFRLDQGPKEHFTRPAIDPLFSSAARYYGPRVVGVLLSGGGKDGVNGLIAIKAAGGVSIAQEPREAPAPQMPESAIRYDDVDLILPVARIANALVSLATGKEMPHTAPGAS